MRYYQDGGIIPQQQAQMQAPPQQMQQPQQVNPQQQSQGNDQLMQLLAAYFQMMQMDQNAQQQFISEFQGLSPQEQQQVVTYIQQQLQGGQPQESPIGEQQEYQQGQQNSQEESQEQMQQAGGSIYIDPKHAGIFTAKAKSHGMTVPQFENHVLANKSYYPMETIKQAQFSKNARSWQHQVGGEITPVNYGMSKMAYDYKPMGFNQVGADTSDFDTPESLAERTNSMPVQGFSNLPTTQSLKQDLLQDPSSLPQDYTFPNTVVQQQVQEPSPIVTPTQTPVVKDGFMYVPYGDKLIQVPVAGNYGKSVATTSESGTHGDLKTYKVSLADSNKAATTPISEQTPKLRYAAKNVVPQVQEFQQFLEETTGKGTGTGGKKNRFDGVFGDVTYQRAKEAYDILHNTQGADEKDVNGWIKQLFPNVNIPAKHLSNLALPYSGEQSDSTNGVTNPVGVLNKAVETINNESNVNIANRSIPKVDDVQKYNWNTYDNINDRLKSAKPIPQDKSDISSKIKDDAYYNKINKDTVRQLDVKTWSSVKPSDNFVMVGTYNSQFGSNLVYDKANDSYLVRDNSGSYHKPDANTAKRIIDSTGFIANPMSKPNSDSKSINSPVPYNRPKINTLTEKRDGKYPIDNGLNIHNISDRYKDLGDGYVYDPVDKKYLFRGNVTGRYKEISDTPTLNYLEKVNKKQVGGISDSLGTKVSTANDYKENKYAVGGTVKKQTIPVDSDVSSSIRKFVDSATPDQDYLNKLNAGTANTSKFIKINDNTVFDPVAKKVIVKNAYGTWGSAGSSDKGATGTTLANILKTKEGQAFLKNNRHLIK